jgi:hypothetical protein
VTTHSHTITPRDLPEIRAELATWLTDPGEHGGPNTWSAHHDPAMAANERRAAGDWARSLTLADLYYIDTDMAHLAVNAGQALPAYRLHPEDLPARNGLMIWGTPITTGHEGGEYTGAPLTAATWAVTGDGVQIRFWAEREHWLTFMAAGDPRGGLRTLTPAEVRLVRQLNPQPITCMNASHLPFGKIPGWLRTAPEQTDTMSPYELESHTRALDSLEEAERALVVSWLLLGQTLVREETVHASKASLKRIARLDPALLTTTRYVQLRHRSLPAQDRTGEGTGRTLRHRFVVRGHWRNQYYPSRKTNRPIWIDDHLKGPDGAPILDPDKLVNILRR